MTDTAVKPKLEEIATSEESVYDALLSRTAESMQDLVERVADTGATCMEREVEFDGQTWTVTVRVKGQDGLRKAAFPGCSAATAT